MNTLAGEGRHEETIQRSRFVAIAFPACGEEGFLARLGEIRAEFPGATHFVWAYSVRESGGQLRTRFHDDGEPKNSAGKPALAPLQGRELINAAGVVGRYFGGSTLGVGGLGRASGGAAAAALDAAGVTPLVRRERHRLEVPYAVLRETEHRLAARGARILHKEFAANVIIEYELTVPE